MEVEKTGRSTVDDTWDDEAELDDELQLNIKGTFHGGDKTQEGRHGGEKLQDERRSDTDSNSPQSAAKPKQSMRKLHPQSSPSQDD